MQFKTGQGDIEPKYKFTINSRSMAAVIDETTKNEYRWSFYKLLSFDPTILEREVQQQCARAGMPYEYVTRHDIGFSTHVVVPFFGYERLKLDKGRFGVRFSPSLSGSQLVALDFYTAAADCPWIERTTGFVPDMLSVKKFGDDLFAVHVLDFLHYVKTCGEGLPEQKRLVDMAQDEDEWLKEFLTKLSQ